MVGKILVILNDIRSIFSGKPRRLMVYISVLTTLIGYSFIAPILAPYPPTRWFTCPKDMPPSLTYLFGTTSLGQNLFWLVPEALKGSFLIALITACISVLMALLIGSVAGHVRGNISSNAFTFFIDGFCIIPALPIIVLTSVFWKEYATLIFLALLLAVFGWAWPARGVRSLVLSLRERSFIFTAKLSGYSTFEIIFKEYLLFIISWLIVNMLTVMLWAISMEIALAIFGILPLDVATLGTVIYWAWSYQSIPRGVWWWLFFPTLFLVIFAVMLYMVAHELNKILRRV